MNIFEAIFLGAVQGITEFIPVSSSGHLIILRNFIGLKEIPLLFDILLHFSTLLVVIIIFRSRIAQLFIVLYRLIRSGVGAEDRENLKTIYLILSATVATAVVGFLILPLEDFLVGSPRFVSILLVLTGILLFVSRYFKGEQGYLEMRAVKGAFIGLAQGLGVLAGISRSGITISAALLCGLERKRAGEFSFLIAIPAILGALILQIKDVDNLIAVVNLPVLLAGLISSFILGFFSLLLLLRLINRGKIYLFSYYLIPVGILTFLVL
ncbi:MAG: undecaprenyl-diphosphatase [Spirochaeta sp.]|nr:undecaprenyl-diphosphatase [Spirochaeta sp.]